MASDVSGDDDVLARAPISTWSQLSQQPLHRAWTSAEGNSPATMPAADRLDVGTQRAIVVEHGTRARTRCVRRARARARASTATSAAQIDGLRGGEQLDGDQVAQRRDDRAPSWRRRARAIVAWSSTALRHGQDVERRRIGEMANLVRTARSASSAIVANPECSGPRRVSCSGKSESAGEIQLLAALRRTARRLRQRDAAARRTRARAPAMWKLPLDSIVVVGEHQRAVGGAVQLDLDVVARACAAPPARAPCTCATHAERQRVLHAARGAGVPQRAAGEQRRQPRGDRRAAPAQAARPAARGSSGDRLARKPSNDSAAATFSASQRVARSRAAPAPRGRRSRRLR